MKTGSPTTCTVNFLHGAIQPVVDLIVTFVLWTYFIAGYLLIFSPAHLFCLLFRRPESDFQRVNHLYFKSFFRLLRFVIPRARFHVSKAVRRLRGGVVICNHISFLDPIFLISIFPRHKTIAKRPFFHIPIFGGLLKKTGFIPSETDSELGDILIDQMETMGAYFDSGGILFVFPEGTRGDERRIRSFNKGAFRIARRFQVPVYILFLENTHRIYPPGTIRFNAACRKTITVTLLDALHPDAYSDSLRTFMEDARSRMQQHLNAQNQIGSL